MTTLAKTLTSIIATITEPDWILFSGSLFSACARILTGFLALFLFLTADTSQKAKWIEERE